MTPDEFNAKANRLARLGFGPGDFEGVDHSDGQGISFAWLSDAAEPTEAQLASVAAYPAVHSVTPAQALLALDQAGLLAGVEATVAAHPVKAIRVWYERALIWERSNPYLQGLAMELGLDDDHVDALFYAASLKA